MKVEHSDTYGTRQEFPLDAALFGAMGEATAKLCSEVSRDLVGRELPLMTVEQFSSLREIPRINRIYWRDLLFRVYWASCLSLRRHRKWQSGCTKAFEKPANLLSFAANLRGLIEGSLDTQYSLGNVPATLANIREPIRAALEGNLKDKHYLSKDLEEQLIHFVYARRLDKTEKSRDPESHQALEPKDYRNAIGLPEHLRESFRGLYDELCGMCHPTAFSCWMMWEETTDAHIRLKESEDSLAIQSLCERYKTTIDFAMSFGVTTSALCLKTLNCFPLSEIWCMPVERVSFENVPLWKKLEPVLLSGQ